LVSQATALVCIDYSKQVRSRGAMILSANPAQITALAEALYCR
jgi:hypothetical protein